MAELVAEGEDALLGPRALLVAAGAAEGRIEAVLGDRIEQRDRLQPVARGFRGWSPRRRDSLSIESSDGGHDQALAISGTRLHRDTSIAPGRLWPGPTHHREGERPGTKRLLGQAQQHDRVLAAAEQQHRALELGGDLAHHLDRLGLERAQVG